MVQMVQDSVEQRPDLECLVIAPALQHLRDEAVDAAAAT